MWPHLRSDSHMPLRSKPRFLLIIKRTDYSSECRRKCLRVSVSLMVACDYVGFVRLFFFCSAGLELGFLWKQGVFSLRMTAPVLYVWHLNRVWLLNRVNVRMACGHLLHQKVILTVLLLWLRQSNAFIVIMPTVFLSFLFFVFFFPLSVRKTNKPLKLN